MPAEFRSDSIDVFLCGRLIIGPKRDLTWVEFLLEDLPLQILVEPVGFPPSVNLFECILELLVDLQ